jgi:hypothetical protein
MDVGRKLWTRLDEIIREISQQRPAKSTDFRLPTVDIDSDLAFDRRCGVRSTVLAQWLEGPPAHRAS